MVWSYWSTCRRCAKKMFDADGFVSSVQLSNECVGRKSTGREKGELVKQGYWNDWIKHSTSSRRNGRDLHGNGTVQWHFAEELEWGHFV